MRAHHSSVVTKWSQTGHVTKIVKTVKNITLLVNKNEFHEWWYKVPPACHRLVLETELSFINELNVWATNPFN